MGGVAGGASRLLLGAMASQQSWGVGVCACGTSALSSKEDLERGGLTWPPLAVLGEELLVHLPLLLLFLDLGFLVDLLDGLGALVRPPGHPVVLRGRETRRWRGTSARPHGGNDPSRARSTFSTVPLLYSRTSSLFGHLMLTFRR